MQKLNKSDLRYCVIITIILLRRGKVIQIPKLPSMYQYQAFNPIRDGTVDGTLLL